VTVRILQGDCREVLKTLPGESVHCVVTSPPYFGLRDYDVDNQIGLETSPGEYIATMVATFAEVRRVLRADGTLWLNLGDSYASGGRGGNSTHASSTFHGGKKNQDASAPVRRRKPPIEFKTKDLMMMPARVAIALQEDGWYLRQDIVWSKPNPMPESVRDRCTKAHEYVFLLSKSPQYYYDADAIAEPVSAATIERLSQPNLPNQAGSDRVPGKSNGPMKAVGKGNRRTFRGGGVYTQGRSFDNDVRPCNESIGNVPNESGTRNKRSVWEITTKGFGEAHFATFPPELPEICISAGCPRGGVVLDPFGGAGTTGLVADRLQRDCILIELNPDYAAMAERRIKGDAPMFAEVKS
jgi:DNA modification methylase